MWTVVAHSSRGKTSWKCKVVIYTVCKIVSWIKYVRRALQTFGLAGCTSRCQTSARWQDCSGTIIWDPRVSQALHKQQQTPSHSLLTIPSTPILNSSNRRANIDKNGIYEVSYHWRTISCPEQWGRTRGGFGWMDRLAVGWSSEDQYY